MRVLSLIILAVGALSCDAAELPAPLVEFGFDGSVRNAGALGGQGEMIEYAPGEGPTYGRGIRGTAVSFENSARSGGVSLTLKAGGAVTFTDERLAGLRKWTLCLWFVPLDAAGPARLLYMPPEWDLMIGGFKLSFKVIAHEKDHFMHLTGGGPSAGEGQWNFAAISGDAETGTVRMYLGVGTERVAEVGRWESVPEADEGSGALQIGNLRGIRPFRGLIDSVRIYDVALSEEEVRAVHAKDLRGRRTLKDYAVAPAGSGVPGFKHSDVFFSTRWARENAVETIKAFGANHVVWVYTSDPKFVASVHGAGATIQGAINSVPRTKDLSAYAVDLDGTKLVAPWMVNFNKKDPVKWGCNNQPAFREVVLANAKKALDAGVDWFQFDDGALIVSAHSWGGGCMCDRCMEEFREYLGGLPPETLADLGIEDLEGFDYRRFLAQKYDIRDAETYKRERARLPTTRYFEDFQRKSVRSYFEGLRADLDEYAGRRVPLSINSNLQNPSQDRNFLVDIVDFLLGETWSEKLADLAICARSAQALGKHQIVSPFPHNVNDTRIAMAATYALGEFLLVPWDIWMGPKAPDRYFGTIEEYGDLYEFVRDNPELFDGYEAPGMVGVVVNTDHYDSGRTGRLVDRLLRAQVPFAFVLTGHKHFDLELDPARLERFEMIVSTEDLESLAEADREALEGVREKTPILTDRQIGDRVLAQLAPVQVWGPEGIYALPRVSTDPESRVLICHLLNRNQTGAEKKVTPLRYVSIGLRSAALLGSDIKSAIWHAPGCEPEDILLDELPAGFRFIIPELGEWGIARIQFGD